LFKAQEIDWRHIFLRRQTWNHFGDSNAGSCADTKIHDNMD